MNEPLQNGTPRIPHKIRFVGFAPDVDPITPGALLDMTNLYPTAKGYRTYVGLARYTENMLPSACLGAFSCVIGADHVLAAGVSGQLYLLVGTTLTASGAATSPITGRWRFDIYGNDLIAVNGVDPAKVYNGTGTFVDLAGSPPIASIVQATGYSLFLIKVNSSDWISTLNDTIWAPSIATETVQGTLRRGSGNITAAHKVRGGGIALYKRKHISVGRFSGPPFYWDFGDGISDEVGAPGQEAVANIGGVHYFPGPDDFYSCDGVSINRIPNNLKEWFFDHLNQTLDYLICARWDQTKSLIFWHFPSIDADPPEALDAWICYNLRSGKWTADLTPPRIDMPVFGAIQTGQITYASLTETYPTYGDMDFLYGDLQSRTVDISGAFRHSDHALYLYNGQPGQASFTTHDFGDRESLYQVTRLKPHYEIYPADGATIQPLNQKHRPGQTPVPGPTKTLSSDGAFNVHNTALLQRYKHVGLSEFEVTGIDAAVEYAGES